MTKEMEMILECRLEKDINIKKTDLAKADAKKLMGKMGAPGAAAFGKTANG